MSTLIKIIITIIVIIGLVIGMWLAAPLFYDKEVSEALPGAATNDTTPTSRTPSTTTNETGTTPTNTTAPAPATTEPQTLSQGTFEGFDRLHQADGTARIVEIDGKRYLRFEDNFTVTNGPDLFVHLGRNGEYAAEANLGRLKGNVGSQNYEIPDDLDLSQYNEAWVWCRAFFVPFGKAQLR